MWISLLLFVSAGALVCLYFVWNFGYWRKRGVPGPKPVFLLGNIPSAITQKRNILYDADDLYCEARLEHRFIGYLNIRSPQVLAIHPEIVKDVLIRDFKSFHDNEFADFVDKDSDPILARNPFMLKGVEWKEKRAEITPAFTSSRIKAMSPLMEDVCKRMTQYVRDEIKDSPADGIEGKELAAKYTTDVVSSCIFAFDAGSFTQKDPIIRKMGSQLMKTTPFQMIYFTLITVMPWIKHFYVMPFAGKKFESFFSDVMSQAVKYRTENKIDRLDYLQHLIQLKEKKNLSDVDMAAHGVTFFIDGFETSSIVLSMTLYCLASYPDIQQQVRDELRDAADEKGNIPFEVLQELPLLDAVFSESLRLYPPGAQLTKICTEPTFLVDAKDKKIPIDVGTIVMIPIYSIHHDPQHYPEPEVFKPERFSQENGGTKAYMDKGVYLPFGAGPRICLGQKFAMAQLKAGLVEIVQKFELSVNKKTKEPLVYTETDFILQVKGGVWLDFKAISN